MSKYQRLHLALRTCSTGRTPGMAAVCACTSAYTRSAFAATCLPDVLLGAYTGAAHTKSSLRDHPRGENRVLPAIVPMFGWRGCVGIKAPSLIVKGDTQQNRDLD